MRKNKSVDESRDVFDDDHDDATDVFDDEHEESYYVTPEEEQQRRHTKILAAVVAVVGLATAAAIIWTINAVSPKDDAHDVTAGDAPTLDVQLGENDAESDEEPRETKADDSAKRNRIVDSDDGSVAGNPALAESIDRPNGDKAQGNPVIANDDVIIKDEEYVNKIMDTAQRGYDALEGLPVLASDAGNHASDEDTAAVSAVANEYYYSDMRDTVMLTIARKAGWRFDKSKSYVYEGDTNAPLVGMSYVDDSGELMLYMEGYYDPTIDAFKLESFEFTDAARKANDHIF